MDERTKQALLGSIAKWEAIVSGTGCDAASDNCPLCAEFADKIDPEAEPDDNGHLPENAGCHGCPVKVAAGGLSGCIGTPWQPWVKGTSYSHVGPYGSGHYADTPERRKLAQAELDFLRGLAEPEAEDQP